MTCHGPILSQVDGVRHCPRTADDEFDCEACQAEEQDWADRINDMEEREH